MKATKLDLTKEFRNYYRAKATPEVVELGEAPFLTLEGKGDRAVASLLVKLKPYILLLTVLKISQRNKAKISLCQNLRPSGGLNRANCSLKCRRKNGDGSF